MGGKLNLRATLPYRKTSINITQNKGNTIMNMESLENPLVISWENLMATIVVTIIVVWFYAKSPTSKDKVRLTTVIGLTVISGLLITFTRGAWAHMILTGFPLFHQWVIFPTLLLTAISAVLVFLSIGAWKKNGLPNMKKYSEHGLIFCLTWGLVFGIIAAIGFGLFGEEFSSGLFDRLAGGLFSMLTIGLLIGSISEFKKKQAPRRTGGGEVP